LAPAKTVSAKPDPHRTVVVGSFPESGHQHLQEYHEWAVSRSSATTSFGSAEILGNQLHLHCQDPLFRTIFDTMVHMPPSEEIAFEGTCPGRRF
jgi:hypothetical protein